MSHAPDAALPQAGTAATLRWARPSNCWFTGKDGVPIVSGYDSSRLDDYVPVAERITEFREHYPDGRLQPANPLEPWKISQVQGFDKNGDVVMQTFIAYTAAAYRTPDDPRPGIGCAWEIFPGRTPYTRGSELMNAETSAWGRAIVAALAADAKRGVATAEDVAAAREREEFMPTAAEQRAGKQRARAVDDMWTGQSAGHLPTSNQAPEEAAGSVDSRQTTRLHAAFRQLGVEDRGDRLEQVREMIGRPLESSKDLSWREAETVIGQLEQRLAAQEKAGMR